MSRHEIPGYQIDTGTARLVPDDQLDDAFTLYLNGVPSSHVAIGRPLHLDFEYMRWIAAVVQRFVDAHLDADKLRVTHLGGAGCSLPRFLAAVYPRSRHTVVEIDAALAKLVREVFDIPRSPTVKIRVGEAREVVDSLRPATRDVIVRDVFADAVTPEPLTTTEFFAACASTLVPGGLYVANCGDHADLTGARAELAGMAEVFDHLAVIADPPMLKGRRYGNIVLVGSDTPLPADRDPDLTRELLGGAVPAKYHAGAWVERFRSGGRARHDAPAARD